MTEAQLAALVRSVVPPDANALAAATVRQDTLTKPPGSLGRLETLAARVAAIQCRARPDVDRKLVLVAAGDHGVVAEGVSAYPQAVTVQMVANFLRGGAAINVLAREAGARVLVADFGVAATIPPSEGLLDRKVAPGTANFATGPAMSRAQAVQALLAGAGIVQSHVAANTDLLAAGEMGIGNTTSAAALAAIFTGLPPAVCTGRGTGVDDAGLARKCAVIERALALHRPDAADPVGVLAAVGGFEIAGLAGAMIAAAASRIPVVLDGFITGSAALVAQALCPAVREYLLPSHRSVEPGHAAVLDALGMEPLFDLGMRLGEGTGAVLAMGIIASAVAALNEMATFGEAGVSGRSE